jgi:hypothetical protein
MLVRFAQTDRRSDNERARYTCDDDQASSPIEAAFV